MVSDLKDIESVLTVMISGSGEPVLLCPVLQEIKIQQVVINMHARWKMFRSDEMGVKYFIIVLLLLSSIKLTLIYGVIVFIHGLFNDRDVFTAIPVIEFNMTLIDSTYIPFL